MNVRTTLAHISLISFLTTTAITQTRHLDQRPYAYALGGPFALLLDRITAESRPQEQEKLITSLAERLSRYGRAIVEDTTVYFVYVGRATRVSVASDLNGWSADADVMNQVGKTRLFYLKKDVASAARFEYKFVIDGEWKPDPFNKQYAVGGFGPNSEIWMPGYRPPAEVAPRPWIVHGEIDTLVAESVTLGRTHPVMVYLPPGYAATDGSYPTIFVTDGGEYLSLALMNNVLDNLIGDGKIPPVIGVFIDPRTDVLQPSSNRRMSDYAMSDTFVTFLVSELRPLLMSTYRMLEDPAHTAIMGASLGGLISTYAAFTHPEVFGLAAAQSPAFWLKKGAIFDSLEQSPKKPLRFYIDTGTIRDAQEHAMRMKKILERKGYEFSYAEYPEAHNWVNWRARIPAILTYFLGKPR